VKILSDQGVITRVRLTEIDKKIPLDRKAFARDQVGNIICIDDVVKCVGSSEKRQAFSKERKELSKTFARLAFFFGIPKISLILEEYLLKA
jgi:hypothetical protein